MNGNDDNDNDNAKNTNNKHFLLQEEEFRPRSRDDLKTVWLLWLRPYSYKSGPLLRRRKNHTG